MASLVEGTKVRIMIIAAPITKAMEATMQSFLKIPDPDYDLDHHLIQWHLSQAHR